VEYPTADWGRGRSRSFGVRAGQGQCTANFRLDAPLRRSLARWVGQQDVGRAHRCRLRRHHHGAHQALIHHHRGTHCWFRWDEWGFRLGGPGPPSSARRRHPPPAGAPAKPRHRTKALPDDTEPIMVARPNTSMPPRDSPQSKLSAEAVWALVAAVERLADAIAVVGQSSSARQQPR
jgi:hypothetical protein